MCVFVLKEAILTQPLKNVWSALLHWDGIQPSISARLAQQTLTSIKVPRAASAAQSLIQFGMEPTVSVAQQTPISIWSHSSVFLAQETWSLTKLLSSVSAHRPLLTTQAMVIVLAATGPGTGTWIPRLATNVLTVLITIKILKCAPHALRIYPSGMEQLALDVHRLNTLIKDQRDACLAQVASPLITPLWSVNVQTICLTFQEEDAFHATLQTTGTPTQNNASHAQQWHTTTALLESAWTVLLMLQFGTEPIVLAAQSELISISPQDNAFHVQLALFSMSASWSVFVLLTLLTFRMELVWLANIQELGTQRPTSACLTHVKKTSTGTSTPTNAHGAQTRLQFGTETSASRAQQELSTSRTDTFAWLVLLAHILTKPSSDVFAQLTLPMSITTLVCNADTQLIGMSKHQLANIVLKD